MLCFLLKFELHCDNKINVLRLERDIMAFDKLKIFHSNPSYENSLPIDLVPYSLQDEIF